MTDEGYVRCSPLRAHVHLVGDGYVNFEFEGKQYQTYIPSTWESRGKDYRFVEISLPDGRTIIGELGEL
jgi:hypothetical protein